MRKKSHMVLYVSLIQQLINYMKLYKNYHKKLKLPKINFNFVLGNLNILVIISNNLKAILIQANILCLL